MSTWSDGPPASGFEPSAWLDRRGIGMSLGGNLALDVGGDHLLAPIDGVRPHGPVLELRAYSSGGPQQGPRGLARALSARLHLVRPEYGAWLASSGFQVDRTHGMLPLLGAGAWVTRGRFTVTTQFVQLLSPLRVARREPTTPKAPTDTSGTAVDRHYAVAPTEEDARLLTGAETSLTWAVQRWAVQSRIGFAVGMHHQPAQWGELGATYWASPGQGIFMRLRTTTRTPGALEAMTESQAALGIQLAVGRTSTTPGPLQAEPTPERSFRIEPLGASRYRITLGAQGQSLDVSSDATEWIPLPARQVSPGRWEVTLTLSPGIHRIAIRVDGGPWQAPTGMPSAPDGFGGEVGLIMVE